ncbi:MAG: GNAT family N-acetyltransferase [Planctomycetota bacterium]
MIDLKKSADLPQDVSNHHESRLPPHPCDTRPAAFHPTDTLTPVRNQPVQNTVVPDQLVGGSDRMRATERSFSELNPPQRARWQAIRAACGGYRTPFFAMEFTEAVSRVREDVSVAVIERGGVAVGFLPFHRIGNVGHPIGRFFNDAHNVIAEPGTDIRWDWLLGQLGLKRFEFHAMAGMSMDEFPAHSCHEVIRSFRSELGDDSEAFLARLAQRHRTIQKQGQKTRKLGREIGPVALEFDCRSPDVLDQIIGWKRQQYRRTYILDLFQPPWTMRLLRELLDRPDSAEVRGVLSVLRAGDHIVAAHFGMVSRGLLHYWFPVYDPAYGAYSPGTALFCEIVKESSARSINCLDMGYGEQPYKLKQTDTVSVVARGCMSKSRVYRHMRCIGSRLAGWTKELPGKQILKRVWRTIHPNAGISKLA